MLFFWLTIVIGNVLIYAHSKIGNYKIGTRWACLQENTIPSVLIAITESICDTMYLIQLVIVTKKRRWTFVVVTSVDFRYSEIASNRLLLKHLIFDLFVLGANYT